LGGRMYVPLCRNCGSEVRPDDKFCPNCGQSRESAKDTAPVTDHGGGGARPDVTNRTEPISEAARSRLLEEAIERFVLRGFFVRLRTSTSAQLVKPKKFSLVWAILWFLLFGVGLLIYVFYYLSKKDEGVYLQVDDYGNITETHQLS
jgi:uncharacterized membrane protein YvbJ